MTVIGLVLQVGGIAIAGLALILELRSDAKLQAQTLPGLRQPPRNPWTAKTDVRYRRPNGLDVRNYRQNVGDTSGLRSRRAGSDPELLAGFEWLLESDEARRKLLAADWAEQQRQDNVMRAELKRLFELQSRQVVQQQLETNKRVRWEGVGLVLAMIGTIISGLAN